MSYDLGFAGAFDNTDVAVVWVTVDDLTAALGASVAADPVGADRAVDAANAAVRHRLQPGEATAHADDPLLETAALTAAIDLYRRPKTPAGVFQQADLYARLPADFYTSIDAAIAASGAQLAGGFA